MIWCDLFDRWGEFRISSNREFGDLRFDQSRLIDQIGHDWSNRGQISGRVASGPGLSNRRVVFDRFDRFKFGKKSWSKRKEKMPFYKAPERPHGAWIMHARPVHFEYIHVARCRCIFVRIGLVGACLCGAKKERFDDDSLLSVKSRGCDLTELSNRVKSWQAFFWRPGRCQMEMQPRNRLTPNI